jgi:hypothetical protein
MNDNGVEIQAPKLNVLDLDEISKFLHDRESYEMAVNDKNAGVRADRRIIPISIKVSIQLSLLKMIAEMELKEEVDNLDDEALIEFLQNKAHASLSQQAAPYLTIFKEIEIKKELKSATARIDDLWAQWFNVREKYSVRTEFMTERGKKVFRDQMVKKLWQEEGVMQRVKDKLKDVDQEATNIRSSDKTFFLYVNQVAEEKRTRQERDSNSNSDRARINRDNNGGRGARGGRFHGRGGSSSGRRFTGERRNFDNNQGNVEGNIVSQRGGPEAGRFNWRGMVRHWLGRGGRGGQFGSQGG